MRYNPRVRVTLAGDVVGCLALQGWLADNDFQPEEVAEIVAALRRYGAYTGGGGAQPIWQVTVVDPAPIAPGMLVKLPASIGEVVELDERDALARVRWSGHCRWLDVRGLTRWVGPPDLTVIPGTGAAA
jgi:hypothetical protein